MAPLRRALLLFVAISVAVAIGALWLAPAALVDSRMAQMTGGVLRIAAAEGTIWRARGVLVAGDLRMPIAWRIEPWPLLRGELRLRVAPEAGATTGAPRADVAVSGERVVLRDVDVTVPASLLAAATGPAAVWVAAGAVGVTTTALEWTPDSLRGDARLHWRGARLVLADGIAPLDLGDVRAVLTANGGRLSGPVSNDGGDVAVRGEITLFLNESVQISLLLTPRRPVDATLARMLSAVSAAGADGWRVDWRVPLR